MLFTRQNAFLLGKSFCKASASTEKQQDLHHLVGDATGIMPVSREARKGQGMKSLAGVGAAPSRFWTAALTYPFRVANRDNILERACVYGRMGECSKWFAGTAMSVGMRLTVKKQTGADGVFPKTRGLRKIPARHARVGLDESAGKE